MTASVATYWCREAWLGGAVAARDVQIDVVDGRIDRVVTGVATPPSGARRRDGLTLPGFANTHSHSFHRALRGRSGGAAGSFWTWREGMYELAASLDPNRFGRLARAVFAEMALAGFTCVGEFHYLHHDRDGTPYANPNVMGDALTEAAADAGLRITLLDTCYLHGGIGVDLDATQRRFDDGSVEAWIDRVGRLATGGHVRLGAAVHSVRACTPSEIAEVAAWASQAGTDGAPLHAHVSEQPAENEACLSAYGRTPTAVLADAGALGPRFTAVHATHVTDDDIGLLGAASSTCCLCPTTERDLADGIGPASRLVRAGSALAVGTDSQAVVDGLEEARAIELDERLVSHTRGGLGPEALLDALTTQGHRALGWADAGRIEVGTRADLVTVSLDSVRLAGSEPAGSLAAVLSAATAADVTHVTVDGVDLVEAGRHCRIDVARELSEAVTAAWA